MNLDLHALIPVEMKNGGGCGRYLQVSEVQIPPRPSQTNFNE